MIIVAPVSVIQGGTVVINLQICQHLRMLDGPIFYLDNVTDDIKPSYWTTVIAPELFFDTPIEC